MIGSDLPITHIILGTQTKTTEVDCFFNRAVELFLLNHI